MNPDGQTDGMDGRHQNYIPPTLSGDNNLHLHSLAFKVAVPFKVPIITAADNNFFNTLLNFRSTQGFTFHVDHLLADDSHEISCLIWIL